MRSNWHWCKRAVVPYLEHKRSKIGHLGEQIQDSPIFQQIHAQIQVCNGLVTVNNKRRWELRLILKLGTIPNHPITLGAPFQTCLLTVSGEQIKHTRAQAQLLLLWRCCFYWDSVFGDAPETRDHRSTLIKSRQDGDRSSRSIYIISTYYLGDAVVRQIQCTEINQFVKVLYFLDTVIVKKQCRELEHVRKIFDRCNRVALKPQCTNACFIHTDEWCVSARFCHI